jgi:hypothetical protein
MFCLMMASLNFAYHVLQEQYSVSFIITDNNTITIMSLPPEIDDFIKQSIDHSLGLPISSQTLDIKLRASKEIEQNLRDQNTSLLQKLKQKDELIEQSKVSFKSSMITIIYFSGMVFFFF